MAGLLPVDKASQVNYAAFATVASLGAVTAATVFAAATTAATVATVAYTILAIGLAGASIASMTAWFEPSSTDVGKYFENMKSHAGIAIAGMYQFAAQTLVMRLVEGLGEGLAKAGSRKIAGPDVTVKYS